MRNARTFQIRPKLSATVSELTVAQALELFWLIGDFVYPLEFETFLQTHSDDALRKVRELVTFTPDIALKKLSVDEQNALIQQFIRVNKAFFQGNSDAPTGNGDDVEEENLTGFEHYKNLSALVNALVRFKHTNVLAYPMSLLNEVVANIGKQDD